MALANKVIYQNGAIREFEKPEVCEAIKVANANRWTVGLSPNEWDEREARLKKEYGKNHIKGDFSGNKSIEHCGEPIPGSPALKESASQFNDALLDEQAKEIERLKEEKTELLGMVERMKQDVKEVDSNFNAVNKENKRLNKKVLELTKDKSNLEEQITVLNACKKHNDKIDRKQIKCLGKEIAKLNGIIHDKNEELKRKTKGCCELIAENVDLKEHLADKVIDEINANALKSAESALAWKEKVVTYKDMALAYYEKKIAEKDEDIRALKLQISALEKRGNGIDWKRNADAIKLYINRASHERLWNPINQDICNEKELSFIINHGGKRVKYALRFDGTDIIYECSDPDKKPRIHTPEIGEEELMKLQEKVCADIAEEGADHSAKVVLCGKDFVKKFKENEDFFHDIFKTRRIKPATDMFTDFGPLDCMELVIPNKPSPFIDENSHGEVTNQKDISPNLKATVRLYGKNIEDLFKEIKSLWQE